MTHLDKLRSIVSTNPNIILVGVGFAFLAFLVIGTFFIAKNIYHKEEPVPVVTVPNTSPNTLQQSMPELTTHDAQDLSHQIERAKEQQAPQYHYYTYTQEAADAKAQEYAAAQHADKIVKETQYVPIYVNGQEQQQQKKAVTAESVTGKKGEIQLTETKTEQGEEGQIIENNYYAINLNRKHSVEVGIKYVNKDVYAAASYRNRDVRYEVMYSPKTKKWGAGVMVTVAKW